MKTGTQTIRVAITAAVITAPSTSSSPVLDPVETVQHLRQLEADEDEQRRVQQEHDDLPHRVALDAGRRSRQPRREAAHVDADRDRRDHARDADRLGGQVGEVGGEEGDRELDRRVVEPPPDRRDHESDGASDRDAAAAR